MTGHFCESMGLLTRARTEQATQRHDGREEPRARLHCPAAAMHIGPKLPILLAQRSTKGSTVEFMVSVGGAQ